jgi:putative intracellular protease/amidase
VHNDTCSSARAFRLLATLVLAWFFGSSLDYESPVRADPPSLTNPIRVAIYDDAGGSKTGLANLDLCLTRPRGFAVQRIKATEVAHGALARFDVLIQPGGSASKQAKTLGEGGRTAVRDFVRSGGGYLGICAGAYLASADYSWSLDLLDAKVIDRKHWARGHGDVQLRLSKTGRRFFAADRDLVSVAYYQGPLLAPGEKPDIPDYEPLAVFETEIARNGAPEGVMKGSTAAARGSFGKGRVFCFSPHPEKETGPRPFVESAVRWAAGAGASSAAD